ncbi:MAG: hypothetical protein KGL39_21800 [Patescibacteria group bacterium]|nr:hypothetical protein [Patescibacteria group bacterium]
MSANRFPNGPKYNKLIERDPQIVKVELDTTEFGARKSAMPASIKNSNTIKHVQ